MLEKLALLLSRLLENEKLGIVAGERALNNLQAQHQCCKQYNNAENGLSASKRSPSTPGACRIGARAWRNRVRHRAGARILLS